MSSCYHSAPDDQLNPKKKIFETIKVSLILVCILVLSNPYFPFQLKSGGSRRVVRLRKYNFLAVAINELVMLTSTLKN